MVQQIAHTRMARNAYGVPDAKTTKEIALKAESNTGYIVSLNSEKNHALSYTDKAALPFESDPEFNSLKNIVDSLLKRQGTTLSLAMSGKSVVVDDQARNEALDLISEDGYWGVNKTSERIFQFAINSAGGDVSKLEAIKGAIEKGFQLAQDAFGGELPDISNKTHDAVMEKLDAWSNNTRNPDDSLEQTA
ncbi:MAG: hypothetical protein KKD44_08765 [Proteobacteria bacterium]|nr:hypothetical protein [Pseudomonadota bacterium]